MFGFELKRIRGIPLLFGRAIRSYGFALAAFLVPVFIRSIPEILVGPYPVGWDTVAFYVPNTLDWATGKTGLICAKRFRVAALETLPEPRSGPSLCEFAGP